MTTNHHATVTHGEFLRDGKRFTWAQGTCTCGHLGARVTTDKPHGWSDVLDCTVHEWAERQLHWHRTEVATRRQQVEATIKGTM